MSTDWSTYIPDFSQSRKIVITIDSATTDQEIVAIEQRIMELIRYGGIMATYEVAADIIPGPYGVRIFQSYAPLGTITLEPC